MANYTNPAVLPKMATISQSLYSAPLGEAGVIAAVRREFAKLNLGQKLQPGQTVAVGAGSRGIASIHLVVRTLVEEIKATGATPFVFPAMGSHGGGTAEGQVEMLASLGMTAEFLGCEIRSSMEVVELGHSPNGLPVYLDKNAASADAIIITNRVKAHTNFRGEVESGLMKMLSIGTGKQRQAAAIHSYGADKLHENIPEIGRAILERAPVIAGFALLEDAYHQMAKVVGIAPADFMKVEIDLLKEVRRTSPKLPLKDIDLLIVERMGKNISGAGMDTNVIGRVRLPGYNEFPEPRITALIVLDLTEESHGNGVGIGLADLTVRRLVNKLDMQALYLNALTGNGPQQGAIPITLETDREAVETAIKYLLPPTDPTKLRVLRIRDTLTLDRMQASQAIVDEIRGLDGMAIESELANIEFDASGALI